MVAFPWSMEFSIRGFFRLASIMEFRTPPPAYDIKDKKATKATKATLSADLPPLFRQGLT